MAKKSLPFSLATMVFLLSLSSSLGKKFLFRRSGSAAVAVWKNGRPATSLGAAFLTTHLSHPQPQPQRQSLFQPQPLFSTKSPRNTHVPNANHNHNTGAAYHASANRQIVQRRNELLRQKREARQKALEKDRRRNLRLRELFHEENGHRKESSSFETGGPPMFAVKVVTCPALRAELKTNGREKRGRMFVERPALFDQLLCNGDEDGGESSFRGVDLNESSNDEIEDFDDLEATNTSYACLSVKALKQTIHEFFRRLKKSTYVLSASLPLLDEQGNVLPHPENDEETETMTGTWKVETDEDVQRAFVEAERFFLRQQQQQQQTDDDSSSASSSTMKRPTLILHVTKDPDAPPPPPPPPYLANLPDPQISPTMTMLSFYSFPPDTGIPSPESTAEQLKRLWRPFRALGRIYVAREGINAQMAVPTNVLPNFLECCTLPAERGGELAEVLGEYMENGMNVDPIPVPMEEFRVNPAFRNLHVRVRSQIVADGLETPLDWQSAGYDMPPLEWHRRLKEAREVREKMERQRKEREGNESEEQNEEPLPPLPIVLDCRNNYETQVGKFELAEPLDTVNFRDSWDVLKERLKDVSKDAPIMTYCTGGIRCVKVNAYLTQEMEFTNVARLAGGVIAYDRTLNEQAPTEEPMFKGVNYVFDGRMGRRITDDQLGTCYTCGSKTHLITNCKNENCHRRMVQCEKCSGTYSGTCSEGCKARVLNGGMVPVKSVIGSKTTSTDQEDEKKEMEYDDEENVVYSNLDDYSDGHSTPAAPLLREIEANTASIFPSGAHMVSGAMQGSFLTTLASMSREGRILEIGSFSGYATACFLEGASLAGKLSGSDMGTREGGGPFVLSLERDARALGLAAAHLKVMSEFGMGEEGAKEASKIRSDGVEDFEKDSVSFTYNDIAGCELIRVSDALATLEEMTSENPSISTAPFDIVFVDADKTRLKEYVDILVSNDRILKKGGLILVDNVLWKGLVLDAASNGSGYESNSEDEDENSSTEKEREALRRNRRARKLANKMHRFNSAVVKDDRVEVLVIPIRDGLSLIRKR
mmetsp:Transcript_24428/g.48954  ORF Transcript_24428/g.48954 Transcript_24428/m.48954 type:complete len:1047 (-) Transcript_24428:35-3175(-)